MPWIPKRSSFDRSVSEFHEHFKIILTSLTPTIRRSIPTSLPTQLCLFLFFSPSRSIHVAQIFLDVWSGALSPYGGYDLRENRSKGVSIKSPLSLQSLSFLPKEGKGHHSLPRKQCSNDTETMTKSWGPKFRENVIQGLMPMML